MIIGDGVTHIQTLGSMSNTYRIIRYTTGVRSLITKDLNTSLFAHTVWYNGFMPPIETPIIKSYLSKNDLGPLRDLLGHT